ncbi:MAG: penicillin-binding protein 1C, partial [Rhodospirillales bacterium]|nr:penicillin-binding protein 1C [Rhodospirillales bacterium]
DRRHVVLVWVGRPDGGALPGGAAIDRAVPILARVFGLLAPAPRVAPVLAGPRDFAPRPDAARLVLADPAPGAVIAALGPVALRAVGGRRPLSFLVDGVKLASVPALREARWRPEGPGFYRIRVLDAAGRSITARVRVMAAGRR